MESLSSCAFSASTTRAISLREFSDVLMYYGGSDETERQPFPMPRRSSITQRRASYAKAGVQGTPAVTLRIPEGAVPERSSHESSSRPASSHSRLGKKRKTAEQRERERRAEELAKRGVELELANLQQRWKEVESSIRYMPHSDLAELHLYFWPSTYTFTGNLPSARVRRPELAMKQSGSRRKGQDESPQTRNPYARRRGGMDVDIDLDFRNKQIGRHQSALIGRLAELSTKNKPTGTPTVLSSLRACIQNFKALVQKQMLRSGIPSEREMRRRRSRSLSRFLDIRAQRRSLTGPPAIRTRGAGDGGPAAGVERQSSSSSATSRSNKPITRLRAALTDGPFAALKQSRIFADEEQDNGRKGVAELVDGDMEEDAFLWGPPEDQEPDEEMEERKKEILRDALTIFLASKLRRKLKKRETDTAAAADSKSQPAAKAPAGLPSRLMPYNLVHSDVSGHQGEEEAWERQLDEALRLMRLRPQQSAAMLQKRSKTQDLFQLLMSSDSLLECQADVDTETASPLEVAQVSVSQALASITRDLRSKSIPETRPADSKLARQRDDVGLRSCKALSRSATRSSLAHGLEQPGAPEELPRRLSPPAKRRQTAPAVQHRTVRGQEGLKSALLMMAHVPDDIQRLVQPS
ncbi:unnamed protein product [Vitrella brassicaformis CCMP3155]|uniref:Uncharacterized protein n=1 Tax=Vitrella brassicaformis (strain CCMP3155) TaxID=1169540 RepID=A0A0G4G7W0_VITBC|nr:unnamed protein product [Vitrella brassicaformis CCMP3155]|eukprot:CEM24707.1 unnamed protein product [Vitrella brassicaformis CCMP3155]